MRLRRLLVEKNGRKYVILDSIVKTGRSMKALKCEVFVNVALVGAPSGMLPAMSGSGQLSAPFSSKTRRDLAPFILSLKRLPS